MSKPRSLPRPQPPVPTRPRPRARAGVDRDAFLPTTAEDVARRGWDAPDIVFVTGDAYVDHPSFAMAILGRWLEASGFRVAILAQPDWKSADAWRALGRPRLFYAVSAGNMDSMINHYTANKKRRNADAYSPGGAIDRRPDRPTAVYAQRCREAWKGVPVVVGGVEASLRRIAHYDYWSDRVWPSILLTSKADLLGYGMGETTILEIARRLDAGESIADLRDLRGVAYLLGKNEALPPARFAGDAGPPDGAARSAVDASRAGDAGEAPEQTIALPDYDAVTGDPRAFATMTRQLHHETNPHNARRLTQRYGPGHGDRLLVVNPPAFPLDEATLDRLHELPYTRLPHPDDAEPPPAWETIKHSVQIMRGCFGGCTFCSITMHQGRAIQSRSAQSILHEVEALAADPDFKGTISDLGGPTANMYRMACTKPEVEKTCRRLSCVHPKICKLLGTDHAPTIDLMRRARTVPGVARVHIASGIRMDLAADEPEYLDELARHHVGGHLKVAPEHVSDRVLALMKKPERGSFEIFAERFAAASKRAGKEQYLVPYFIASHPGSGVDEMIELALYLKRHGYRPRQVQDFIPAPMDIATCMYWTGLDPFTLEPVESARRLTDRQVQRALLQFFAPENWQTVRDALVRAGRTDLIGDGPDCLIPARPPRMPREGERGGPREGSRDGSREGARPTAGYRRASRERGRGRRD
ncbi:MAG: YgiQ family radical SAM protein [Myxococcota bacterium]